MADKMIGRSPSMMGGLLDAVTGGWYSYPGRVRAANERRAQESELWAGLSGGPVNEGPAIPGVTELLGDTDPAPLNAADPNVQRRLIELSRFNPQGANAAMSAIQAAQPETFVGPNGEVLDKKDRSNLGRVLPDYEFQGGAYRDRNNPDSANAMPFVDQGLGTAIVWTDGPGGVKVPMIAGVPGAAESAARKAGLVSRAEAEGKAPYDFVNLPTPTGAPMVSSKAAAAGGVYTGQTPAAAAAAKMTAEAATGAQLDLPKSMDGAKEALTLIKQLKVHDALGARTGLSGMLPAMPGSPGKGFDATLGQLKGKVFLTAYADLKGTGTITEMEGAKAEAAIARLDRAQSADDFKAALGDLESVITAGVKRAEQKAKAGGAKPTISREAAINELRRRGKWPQ